MKYYRLFAALALCGGAVFAQTDANTILKETQDMPSSSSAVRQRVVSNAVPAAATAPVIQNVLTVLGYNVDNSGVPCFECITNGMGNTLGIVQPAPTVHADGVTSYAFDNYLVDNSYDGSCNYTFLIKDAAKKYVVKAGPFAVTLASNSAEIVSTADTIPASAAVAGAGALLTVVQCGSSTTTSEMQLYIEYP